MAETLKGIFERDGPLAREVPGFAPRAVQSRMAEEVAAAFSAGDLRLIEAGTGTGKTFAYLVPALLSGQRVLISTGTKNLQDQLFERDLPRVQAALGVPARVAMLKGRANYLCLYRLKRAGTQSLRFDPRLADIERWSHSTKGGEVSELGEAIEDDALRARITSTADNCLGSKCPDFGTCFVVRARRAALGADIVVVNHHVLLADVVLKEEGFGEILPGVDATIVDEAHQLPELAAQFFGTRVSTRQLRDLAEDVLQEARTLGDLAMLEQAATDMAAPLQSLEIELNLANGRTARSAWMERTQAARAVPGLSAALEALGTALAPHIERNPALSALGERHAAVLTRWRDCAESEDDTRSVRWIEPLGRGGVLHTTPVDGSAGFQRMLQSHPGAWVLTSATLSAGGDFTHFRRELGLEQAGELALASPFDFRSHTRLHLPQNLPDPNAPDFSEQVAQLAGRLIEASGGGAFVLCTSHRALRVVAQHLRTRSRPRLLVQGEDSRSRLVERFAADGNAVLVGTHSFWEGVDVRGRALRLVIIDRLPFTAPGDPVYDARLEALRRRGGNPFLELQLPEAIMALRQGAGRLIRDVNDRGLLVLCDPRLRSKSYGRHVLAALPEMPRVDEPAALEWLGCL